MNVPDNINRPADSAAAPAAYSSVVRRSVAKRSVARRAFSGCSAGFTLLELLVVLVILGLLAGLVGPRLFGKADTAKVQTAETQVQMLKSGLLTYRLDMGRFPGEQEGLAALNQPPSDDDERRYWDGPYLDDKVPEDPWRNPYQYRPVPNSQQGFVLYSYGSDGKRGGEGIAADIGYTPEQ